MNGIILTMSTVSDNVTTEWHRGNTTRTKYTTIFYANK